MFVPTIHLSNFTSDSIADRRFSNPAISSAASRTNRIWRTSRFEGGVGLREHDGHRGYLADSVAAPLPPVPFWAAAPERGPTSRMPPTTMNEASRIERFYDTRRPPAGDAVPREAGRAVVGAGPHGSVPRTRGDAPPVGTAASWARRAHALTRWGAARNHCGLARNGRAPDSHFGGIELYVVRPSWTLRRRCVETHPSEWPRDAARVSSRVSVAAASAV